MVSSIMCWPKIRVEIKKRHKENQISVSPKFGNEFAEISFLGAQDTGKARPGAEGLVTTIRYALL